MPNYQISKPYKNISFFYCLISEEFEKRASKSGVLWPIAWACVIKWFIRFFSKNCALRGTKVFLFKWFQGENECLLGLPIMTTNSFENPITKNLEIFFYHFCFFALTLWSQNLFPFLKMSTKFIMTKSIQNKFIHFMQMSISKQSLQSFKKCIHRWKHS